jgi:hypothetical protein
MTLFMIEETHSYLQAVKKVTLLVPQRLSRKMWRLCVPSKSSVVVGNLSG